jgi:hypothetical protein
VHVIVLMGLSVSGVELNKCGYMIVASKTKSQITLSPTRHLKQMLGEVLEECEEEGRHTLIVTNPSQILCFLLRTVS